LYEALFEGILTWAIIWLIRNKKPFRGFLTGMYLLLYGFFRFFIEYFREPDEDLGYRIEFIKNDLPLAISHPLFSFSTGQILCFLMILAGLVWIVIASHLPNREAIRVYPANAKSNQTAHTESVDRDAERNRRRKLRKKLK
jgi:phosphatidylglycerol:prolipoprotein diacylglycerol transferase